MLLSEIVDNSNVFIDSNIFIYHLTKFEKFADSCLELFQFERVDFITLYKPF